MQPVPANKAFADHVYKTDAIVLRQTSTGEADRILTVLTPYLGKLRLIGRSVRRPKSKIGGHVEPLMHARLMVTKGKSGMDAVSQAETVEAYPALRSNLERTVWGIYCAELVDAFLPDEAPSADVFGLLADTLARLNAGEEGMALRWFELHLLAMTGYRPELQVCTQCRGALAPNRFAFSPDAGGVLCQTCEQANRIEERQTPFLTPSVNALKALRYIQHQPYEEARRLRVPSPLANETEGILRFYIRYLLERDVRSTSFLDHLRRQAAL
ncbi:MAG: DNA repair protein RecO [Dehalococcoidia bacterium]|nr:DNA repair protein RecO [Dehalococcoidia bacterium]